MATEYKLSYTASEINRKLGMVDEMKTALDNDYYTREEMDASFHGFDDFAEGVRNTFDDIDTTLASKADLVDGKIPVEQLPDDIGTGGETGSGGLTEVAWEDIKNRPFYDDSISILFPSDVSNCTTITSQPLEAMGGMSFSFIKVSDDCFATPNETYGALIKVQNDGTVLEFTVKDNNIVNLGNGFGILVLENGFYPLMMNITSVGVSTFPTADMLGEDMIFDAIETGVYFLNIEGMAYTESFEINKGKTLDPKYLPAGSIGYEKGEKILWDGNPTDTYIQPGQIIEWDGSDTGVSIPIPADEDAGRPEGITFYKVAEKLDSLFGWTYQATNGSTVTLNSEEIGTMFDDSGNVIATYGSSDTMWVWNVEQTVPVNVVGADVTFPETGLYFINIEGQFRVQSIYNIVYENLGETKLYKISEALDDDLNGYRMNVTADGESIEIVITDNPESDNDAYYGSTATGSSYGLPYIFNIVTDNESIDCTDTFGAIFEFEKAGLYVIDVNAMEATFNFIAGKDYKVVKIDEKFLPDGAQLKSERKTWIEDSDESYPTSGAIYRALGNRNQLSIQSSVNSWSNDPVSSMAVYNALGGREQLTIDSSVGYSDNPVSSRAVYEALGQRTSLTINDTVNSYSTNPVSSKAVYEAIENKQIKVDSSVQSGSNNAVSGNAVYNKLQNYYTKSEIVNDYCNKSNYYTKSEVDTALDNIDLSNYYTKSEVYTKSELDNLLGDVDEILNEINTLIGE